MRTQVINLEAGKPQYFAMAGGYFEVLQASMPITVTFEAGVAQQVDNLEDVTEGIYVSQLFSGFTVVSASAQSIKVLHGATTGGNRAAPLTGTVNVGNVPAVKPSQATGGTQAAAAVTNASAVLLAANAARAYLFIQNKSDTGTIWLNLRGVAATQANGIRLEPGESFEMAGNRVTAADIYAIGDIAANPDVVVVELV